MLRHETRAISRKNARKAARKVREWSPDRPKVEDADLSLVDEAAKLVKSGTGWEQANTTGLCVSTIYRFRNGEVKYPRFTTLQMIANAHGGRLAIIKDN